MAQAQHITHREIIDGIVITRFSDKRLHAWGTFTHAWTGTLAVGTVLLNKPLPFTLDPTYPLHIGAYTSGGSGTAAQRATSSAYKITIPNNNSVVITNGIGQTVSMSPARISWEVEGYYTDFIEPETDADYIISSTTGGSGDYIYRVQEYNTGFVEIWGTIISRVAIDSGMNNPPIGTYNLPVVIDTSRAYFTSAAIIGGAAGIVSANVAATLNPTGDSFIFRGRTNGESLNNLTCTFKITGWKV